MAKSELLLKKQANNTLTIKTKDYKYWVQIELQNLTKIEQFLTAKEEILKMGRVFTKKIEKSLRKELNFPHD